jgi:hypothetical protein
MLPLQDTFLRYYLCTTIKRQPGYMSVSAQCWIINPYLNFCVYLCSTLTLALTYSGLLRNESQDLLI